MRSIYCLPPLLLTGGCVVFAPSPAVTALEMASVAVTSSATLASSGPANAVVQTYDRFQGACIELNREAPVADFVPALQTELAKHGVQSRVYENVIPADCRYTIHYTASVAWGRRMLSPEYSAYMTEARLELREYGRVLASSSYKPGMLGYDRWSATREKIAPSVRVLAYGVADGKLPEPVLREQADARARGNGRAADTTRGEVP